MSINIIYKHKQSQISSSFDGSIISLENIPNNHLQLDSIEYSQNNNPYKNADDNVLIQEERNIQDKGLMSWGPSINSNDLIFSKIKNDERGDIGGQSKQYIDQIYINNEKDLKEEEYVSDESIDKDEGDKQKLQNKQVISGKEIIGQNKYINQMNIKTNHFDMGISSNQVQQTNLVKDNINSLSCVALNERKNNPLYRFSENIDYDKITDLQMKKHLKVMNKSHISTQQIVPTNIIKKEQKNFSQQKIIQSDLKLTQNTSLKNNNNNNSSLHEMAQYLVFGDQCQSFSSGVNNNNFHDSFSHDTVEIITKNDEKNIKLKQPNIQIKQDGGVSANRLSVPQAGIHIQNIYEAKSTPNFKDYQPNIYQQQQNVQKMNEKQNINIQNEPFKHQNKNIEIQQNEKQQQNILTKQKNENEKNTFTKRKTSITKTEKIKKNVIMGKTPIQFLQNTLKQYSSDNHRNILQGSKVINQNSVNILSQNLQISDRKNPTPITQNQQQNKAKNLQNNNNIDIKNFAEKKIIQHQTNFVQKIKGFQSTFLNTSRSRSKSNNNQNSTLIIDQGKSNIPNTCRNLSKKNINIQSINKVVKNTNSKNKIGVQIKQVPGIIKNKNEKENNNNVIQLDIHPSDIQQKKKKQHDIQLNKINSIKDQIVSPKSLVRYFQQDEDCKSKNARDDLISDSTESNKIKISEINLVEQPIIPKIQNEKPTVQIYLEEEKNQQIFIDQYKLIKGIQLYNNDDTINEKVQNEKNNKGEIFIDISSKLEDEADSEDQQTQHPYYNNSQEQNQNLNLSQNIYEQFIQSSEKKNKKIENQITYKEFEKNEQKLENEDENSIQTPKNNQRNTGEGINNFSLLDYDPLLKYDQNPFEISQIGNGNYYNQSLPYQRLSEKFADQNQNLINFSRILDNNTTIEKNENLTIEGRQDSIEKCFDMLNQQQKNCNQTSSSLQNHQDKIEDYKYQLNCPQRNSKLGRYQNQQKTQVLDSDTNEFKRGQKYKLMQHNDKNESPNGNFTSRSLTYQEDECLDEFTQINETNEEEKQTQSTIDHFENQKKNHAKQNNQFYQDKNIQQKIDIDQVINLQQIKVEEYKVQNTQSNDEITQFDQKIYNTVTDEAGERSQSTNQSPLKINQKQSSLIQKQNQIENILKQETIVINQLNNRQQQFESQNIYENIESPQFGGLAGFEQSKCCIKNLNKENQNTNCQCNDCQQKHISDFQEQIQIKNIQKVQNINQSENYSFKNNYQFPQQINFESIYQQQQYLYQLRDLLEIRPSVIQNYQQNKKSFLSSNTSSQQDSENKIQILAIEGLTQDIRIKIQQICQEWWDCTQENNSLYAIAVYYQQQVQENFYKSSIQNQKLNKDQIDYLSKQNYEKSKSIRQSVLLQSIVIGMTAFFSMLSRSQKIEKNSSNISNCSELNHKQDLELRGKLSQLIKIIYDQFILSLSYVLGKIAGYEQCILNKNSYEHKLYNQYIEHIHLLFVNKKIQCEDDYLIFNSKNQFKQFNVNQYIANEENRDYQLNQLSKRLNDNCNKILDAEIELQKKEQNYGNINLLCVIKDIAFHSSEIDFQEAKNHIFEGISSSEVMPQSSKAVQENNEQLEAFDINSEIFKDSFGPISYSNQDKYNCQLQEENNFASSCKYGINLIKNFNKDVNQIIQEESREESYNTSMITSKQDISITNFIKNEERERSFDEISLEDIPKY